MRRPVIAAAMTMVILLSSPIAAGASPRSQFVKWVSLVQTVTSKYASDYMKGKVAIATGHYMAMATTCVNYQSLGANLQSAPQTSDMLLNLLTEKASTLLYNTGGDCLSLMAAPTAKKASQLGRDFTAFATLENQLVAKATVDSKRY